MKIFDSMKPIFIIAFTILTAVSCGRSVRSGGFTESEISLLKGADSLMRVLTIEDSLDLAVLRAVSRNLPAEALLSEGFERLSSLMISTVTHPSQDGVGIAAPQVGLNRRVVAVQRFDKDGEPFEVYPNIRIVCMSDSTAFGAEGCLSVPDMRADVLRSQEVVIEYTDMEKLRALALEMGAGQFRKYLKSDSRKDSSTSLLPTVRDTVKGFTAVIFQHETDHLDGILYIDRL